MDSIQSLYKLFLAHPKISTDSRKVQKNSIFFALKGDHFDGNQYGEAAISVGARYAVIDDAKYKNGTQYILVKDTLTALQRLATYHRKQLSIPVLGITGSNGKTTTKELIANVLSAKYNTCYTEGNLNNHIGVPLSILRISGSHELAIIEMGANHIGEIKQLCEIARPDYGIITNIGKAHIEGFGSLEGVARAKSELYEHLRLNNGKVILNGDDELLRSLATGIAQLTYGSGNRNQVIGHINSVLPYLQIEWNYKSAKYYTDTQLYGRYNFYNLMAAIAVGIEFKVPAEKINEGISNYIPSNNRSQQIDTGNNRVFLDAYNANPVSMREAILSFKEMKPVNPLIILGDMFELGHLSIEEHTAIIQLLLNESFVNVILVGKDFYKLRSGNPYKCFETTDDALNYIKRNSPKAKTILIKGSRGMALEKMIKVL